MIGIVLSLLAALATSLSVVLVRRRLNESNFFSVALVFAVIGNIIVWPLVLLFSNLRIVSLEGVLFFAIAGALAPGITRLLYFKSYGVVGVSVTTSISATFPMYTSMFAVLLLGEVLTLENWVGIICILAGVLYIQKSLSKPKIGPERRSKKGLIFPLLATLFFSISYIVRKHGLNTCNEPLLGVAIGTLSSFLLYLPLSIFSYTTRRFRILRKDFRLFWKAGVSMSLAVVFSFHALSHENVSTVTSLIQTQPLFVLFLAYIYLKELEHISVKLVMSTLLIVMGVMLVVMR